MQERAETPAPALPKTYLTHTRKGAHYIMQQTLNIKKEKGIFSVIKNKKASLLWELMLVLAILFTFLYSTINMLGAYVQFERLSYAAKTTARQIEVTGTTKNAVHDIETLLAGSQITLDPDNGIEIDILPPGSLMSESYWVDTTTGTQVQLRQQFVMRIKGTCEVSVLGSDGIFGELVLNMPMSYEVTGMSEKYWRTGETD